MAKRRHTDIVVPSDLSERTLPALPIYKRKLPVLLQQSKSVLNVHSSKCCNAPCSINVQTKTQSIRPNAGALTPNTKRTRSASMKLRQSVKNLFNKKDGHKAWFISMTKSKSMTASSTTLNSNATCSNHGSNRSSKRVSIKWHPTLRDIYNDAQLLSSVTAFMTKQYNEENILFLQSVKELNRKMSSDECDECIKLIYSQYILHNAPKQVNLSYECFMNILSQKDTFHDLNINDKKPMFDFAVLEIEKLISTSILPGFYLSDEFQIMMESEAATISDLEVELVDESYLSVSTPSASFSIDEFETKTPFDEHWHDCGPSPQFDIEGDEYIASSVGFSSGYHEWSVKIAKCDGWRQEVGVVSNIDSNVQINDSISTTPQFGARAVYGYNKKKHSTAYYYKALNENNSLRIDKDLSSLAIHQHAWKEDDVIKVCLNLEKGNIKFYYNGQKVRRTISVQNNMIYYPIVCYKGECHYKLV